MAFNINAEEKKAQMEEKREEEVPSFDWVEIHSDINKRKGRGPQNEMEEFMYHPARPTFIQKCKENPLVPLGIFATCGFLTVGIVSMFQRNTQLSQYMMRGRVGAQFFTIIAAAVGLNYSAATDKKKKS